MSNVFVSSVVAVWYLHSLLRCLCTLGLPFMAAIFTLFGGEASSDCLAGLLLCCCCCCCCCILMMSPLQTPPPLLETE